MSSTANNLSRQRLINANVKMRTTCSSGGWGTAAYRVRFGADAMFVADRLACEHRRILSLDEIPQVVVNIPVRSLRFM